MSSASSNSRSSFARQSTLSRLASGECRVPNTFHSRRWSLCLSTLTMLRCISCHRVQPHRSHPYATIIRRSLRASPLTTPTSIPHSSINSSLTSSIYHPHRNSWLHHRADSSYSRFAMEATLGLFVACRYFWLHISRMRRSACFDDSTGMRPVFPSGRNC